MSGYVVNCIVAYWCSFFFFFFFFFFFLCCGVYVISVMLLYYIACIFTANVSCRCVLMLSAMIFHDVAVPYVVSYRCMLFHVVVLYNRVWYVLVCTIVSVWYGVRCWLCWFGVVCDVICCVVLWFV